MKKPSNLGKIIADLTKGHGSQKVSPALRKIEVESIPSSGAYKSHRLFVKKVLPRLKYNNQSLDIDVRWIERVQKKQSGPQSTIVGESQTADLTNNISGTSQNSPRMPVKARLLFDGLPTREINLKKDSSVPEMTNEILKAIRETTGEDESSSTANLNRGPSEAAKTSQLAQ